jgi:predicted nucleotidyltransferase
VQAELARDLETFRERLLTRFGEDLVTLAVFGSRAREQERPSSDLDVLIVIRGLPRRRSDRWRLLSPLAHAVSDPFAETLSAILLTPEEAVSVKPFYLGFLDGHRLLVDRDGFFRAVLDRLEKRLAELGSRRLWDEQGNPYWDLKPDYVLGEDVVL